MQDWNIPAEITAVLERLQRAGHEAWIVGGCVRDRLLGREPGDWDVTTSALPQETLQCFADCRTVPNGLVHGTVLVLWQEMPVEITTYRVDGTYSDSRHPDSVAFTPDLREDLARRDFTVNAMAYAPGKGICDEFGGQEDLKRKRIRCVGDAGKRFTEDALRILRALRFAAVLDFSLEEQTAAAVLDQRERLRQIAVERILTEWKKLLCGKAAEGILRDFSPVWEIFLPELESLWRETECWQYTVRNVCRAPEDFSLRMALFFRSLSGCREEQRKTAETVLRRLKAEKKTILEVLRLISAEMPCPDTVGMRRFLSESGPELAKKRLLLLQAEGFRIQKAQELLNEIVARGDCVSLSGLALKGNDLPGAGAATKTLLQQALQGVMEDRVRNEREALLAYLNRQ